jgi:hypothetical protein
VGEEAPGKLDGTLRVRSLSRDLSRRFGLEKERGRWNGGAESPETTAQAAAEVEHTEVEPCRGLDEDATAI